jgi:hypothetical protein
LWTEAWTQANFSGKYWAKSVILKPNRLMAYVDAAFVQKILHISKRKRETDIHHNGQTDDLWARLEVAKGAAFCYPATLIARPARFNQFCSDSAQAIRGCTLRADIHTS